MNLYKCVVRYRNSPQHAFNVKYFWIESDDALAAYIKVQQLTKDLYYQVCEPDIDLCVFPAPDYVCTTDQILKEYGEITYQKANQDTKYAPWRKLNL